MITASVPASRNGPNASCDLREARRAALALRPAALRLPFVEADDHAEVSLCQGDRVHGWPGEIEGLVYGVQAG